MEKYSFMKTKQKQKNNLFIDIASDILLQLYCINSVLLWCNAMGYQKNGLHSTNAIGNDSS